RSVPPSLRQEQLPLKAVCVAFVDAKPGVTRLYPLLGGQVTKLHHHDNDEVAEKEPLFEVDPTAQVDQLRQAEAELAAAKAQVEGAAILEKQQSEQIAAKKAAVESRKAELKAAEIRRDKVERQNSQTPKLASDDDLRMAKEAVRGLEKSVAATEAEQ